MPPFPRALHAFLLAASALAAPPSGFNLSNVFSSHAVIQRDQAAPFWGWFADASRAQSVSLTWLDGAVYRSAPSDASGFWRLVAPSSPLHSTPFNLTFKDESGSELTLVDLLLGDVLACAGQSNMGAVQVKDMANASALVASAALLPTLRIYQVSGNAQSPVRLLEFPSDGLVPWQAPLAGGSNATLLGFSAVCFIMGVTLYSEYLVGAVPLGLLHSSHGGTSIQAWQSSQAVVDACGDPSNSWNSSVLYNSNIHPLTLGPLALRAV